MKIDVLCNDGSPLGVVEADINGGIPGRMGVGGAELALLTMCAAWKFNGHDIVLYNNPRVSKDAVMSPSMKEVEMLVRSPSGLLNSTIFCKTVPCEMISSIME